MLISFRQLEIFVAVAQLGNVTKAAEKLCLTQAAVSMSVNEMEKLLGKKLFERVGRKIVLNEYGRAMFTKAVELLKMVCNFENLLTDKEKVFGSLKIGATITIGNYILPSALAGFIKKYPDVKIEMKIENTKAICKMMDEYGLDIAFIEGFCCAEKVDKIPWIKDRLVIFASNDHPVANKKNINMEDLEKANWILREKGSGTRESFERAIAGKLDKIKIVAEIGNNEAVKKVVESGIGISCLPYESIKRDVALKILKILDIPWMEIEGEFLILISCSKCRTLLLERFLKYILSVNPLSELSVQV